MFKLDLKKSALIAMMIGATMQSFAQTARVQIIHNSPDDVATSVDIYLGDEILVPGLDFRTATPFVDAPAGSEIIIGVAVAGSDDVSDCVAFFPLTLTEDATYIVVADGITGLSMTDYDPAPAFGLQIYPTAREAASMATNTDVLVHHGSTDAPTVDVFETSVPAGTIVDDASYTQFSDYLELGTADYLLEIRTADGATTVAGYAAPLETLELEGAAITVVASGFLDPSVNGDGPAFGLWVALADGGDLIPLPTALLSVNELSEVDFSIFPNPSSEFITINVTNSDVIEQVMITDLTGRIVKTTSFNKQIEISDLENGQYILNIISPEGISSRSFVKN
jgi:hypothetical protein